MMMRKEPLLREKERKWAKKSLDCWNVLYSHMPTQGLNFHVAPTT